MKPTSAKARREIAALRLVYDDRAFFKAAAGDRPDFVLQSAPAISPFGVEITELHASGSSARLRHMPGYALHIIHGGAPKHKEDLLLQSSPVEFTQPDGQKVTGRGLMQTPPTLAQFRASLAAAIEAKAKKAGGYSSDLSHVNVIVIDHCELFALASAEVANVAVLDENVRRAVLRPTINEVFLVTRIAPEPKKEVRRVYIPLRQIAVVTTLFMIGGAARLYAKRRLRSWSSLGEALAGYLCGQGLPADLCKSKNGVELIVGTLGISFANPGGVSVRDYTIRPPFERVAFRPRKNEVWGSPEFAAAFIEYRSKHFVKLPHVFPARGIDP